MPWSATLAGDDWCGLFNQTMIIADLDAGWMISVD